MKSDLNQNPKSSVIKRVYRKIVIHLFIDNLVMPILSFLTVLLKPVMLLILKPIASIITFVSTLAMGWFGFMSKSVAGELGEVTSNEIVEESGSNILEIVLEFFL